MALNIITDYTGYVKFDKYSQVTGTLTNTFDIVKSNVVLIDSYPNTKREGKVGVVVIITNVPDPSTKNSGIIELVPEEWALSGSPTVPIADVAALRTALIGYFETQWS